MKKTTKVRKIRVYVTKADYEKAMQETSAPTPIFSVCQSCVVSQAIRRTFKKLNLFSLYLEELRTNYTYCWIYGGNLYDTNIFTIPQTAKIIMHEFDTKMPFKTGRQFTLEIPESIIKEYS